MFNTIKSFIFPLPKCKLPPDEVEIYWFGVNIQVHPLRDVKNLFTQFIEFALLLNADGDEKSNDLFAPKVPNFF